MQDMIVLHVEILWVMGCCFGGTLAGWFFGAKLSAWCRGKSGHEENIQRLGELLDRMEDQTGDG